MRSTCLGAIALAGVTWDLWSKWWVFKQLGPEGIRPIWSGTIAGIPIQFDLVTRFNRGAVWGIGQNLTWLFALLSIVAVGAIAYFIKTRQAIASWWLTVVTGLLLAGTLGNLYDRLGLHGWRNDQGREFAVRDFLNFIFFNGGFEWATFNFADSFLVTGGIMLVVHSFWTPASSENPATSR